MKKRILAIVLSVCMVLLLFPLCAFANPDSNTVNGAYAGNVWAKGGNGSQSYVTADGTKLTLSKTAVDKGDNTFDINMKVVAESSKELIVPGAAATVLVIDTSESMNYCSVCGQQFCCCKAPSRLDAAKAAAISFIDSYKGTVPCAGRFISIVPFNAKACVACCWVDVSSYFGYCAAINAINCLGTDYGTNLDDGLFVASGMFTAPEICCVAGANRYVVALTDGAPNYSRFGGSGIYGSAQVNADTALTAKALRCCASVYTVGFGTPCDLTYFGGPSVSDFLACSIANPAFCGKTYAYDAKDAWELNKVFAEISKCIVTEAGSSGEGSVVLDPMGKFVSVVAAPEQFVCCNGVYTWVLGSVEPTVCTKFGKTTYTYTYEITYTVKLDADAQCFDESVFHPANMPTYLKWSCFECFAFPVPGLKGHTSRFTVTFNEGTNGDLAGQDENGNVVFPELKMWTATPAAPAVTADLGYSFTGWDPAVAKLVTGDATYVAQYAPNTDTPYTIEYYLEQLDGSFALEKSVGKTGTTDAWVDVTDADVLEFTGYSFDKTVEGTVLGGSIAADGSLALKLFYTLNSYDYSVEYYYGNVLDESKTETGSAKYGTVIDSYVDKPVDGYVFTRTIGLPLTVTDGENVIEVHYDIRSDLGFVVNYYWNGTEESVAPSVTVLNQTFGAEVTEKPIAIEGFTPVSDEAQVITIGLEKNEINFYYYKNVALTAESGEAVYDGENHVVTGYTCDTEGVEFEGITAGVTGKDAGAYDVTFSEGAVGTADVTGKYVVTEVTDGVLTIAPKEVTITSGSASKEYDGEALTCDEVTAEGFVGEDGASYTVTGTQTEVGSSANTFEYALNEGTNEANYVITVVEGTLTVTEAEPEPTPSDDPEPTPTPSDDPEPTPTQNPDTPKTGDEADLALWAALLLLSAGMVVVIVFTRKKNDN